MSVRFSVRITAFGGRMKEENKEVLVSQVAVMLTLQDDINSRVNKDWKQQGFAWYRAVWVECAEMLDHYGWKWWKRQDPDMEQVRLELIDIWHFGLSMLLQSGRSTSDIAEAVASELVIEASASDFREQIECFAAHTLAHKEFSVPLFSQLMQGVELDSSALYRGYVGKNVLNFFRQDHGYKEGTYHKLWSGREDNEHLVEVVAELDSSSDSFSDDVYQALKKR